MIYRFGIPETIVNNNGTQFSRKRFNELLEGLKIKHKYSSLQHLETNKLVEAMNKVISKGLKRRLDIAKGCWAEQLPHVLWAYRKTLCSTVGESPFRLAYGMEAMILAEIREPSWRVLNYDQETKEEIIRFELDLAKERREMECIREASLKRRVKARNNKWVILGSFSEGNLVLNRVDISGRNVKEAKLAENW